MILNFTRPALLAKGLRSKKAQLNRERYQYLVSKKDNVPPDPMQLGGSSKKQLLIIWGTVFFMMSTLLLASFLWG